MRTAGQIKTELIRLRFDKRFRLPMSVIAEGSGCSVGQIIDAMKLEASETILRRLDAYLDADKLHVHKKGTRLLYTIERLKDELWRQYKAQSIPMKDVQLLSPDQQKRLKGAMEWRLKRMLREKVEKEHGAKLIIADGLSYWQAKAQVAARTGELVENRNPRRVQRQGAMGKGR